MNKDFVPYEEALELEELGFDEKNILAYYTIHDKRLINGYSLSTNGFELKAPTFSQAFRWFRDTHNLIGGIQYIGGLKSETTWWDIYVVGHFNTYIYEMSMEYQPYEEAELACLKKLIEIAKDKVKLV